MPGGSGFVRPFSGRSPKPPAADWPTIGRDCIEGHGGRVYLQMYHVRSGTMVFHVVWHNRPDDATVDALRTDLTRTFAWF